MCRCYIAGAKHPARAISPCCPSFRQRFDNRWFFSERAVFFVLAARYRPG